MFGGKCSGQVVSREMKSATVVSFTRIDLFLGFKVDSEMRSKCLEK